MNSKRGSRKRRPRNIADSEPPGPSASSSSLLLKVAASLGQKRLYRPLIVGAAIAILTVLLVPKQSTPPPQLYGVGEIARQDLWAPEEVTIEDEETTTAKREAAAEKVPPVYDYDENAVSQTVRRIRDVFSSLRAGLARRNQMLEALKQAGGVQNRSRTPGGKVAVREKAATGPGGQQREPEVMPTIEDLRKQMCTGLGIELSPRSFELLLADGFSQAAEDCVVAAFATACKDGVVADKGRLISNLKNGITVREVSSRAVHLLAPSVAIAIPDVRGARATAARLVRSECPGLRRLHKVLAQIASGLVKATLTFNKSETETSKARARAAVEPVYYKTKKGQMIVRAREVVTPRQMKIIQAIYSKKAPVKRIYSAVGTPAFLVIVVLLLYLLGARFGLEALADWKSETLFWVVVIVTVVSAKGFLRGVRSFVQTIQRAPFNEFASYYFAAPLALGAVLATVLLGRRSGVAAAFVTASIVPLLLGNHPVILMTTLLSGLAVIYLAQRYEDGALVFKMGLAIGVVAASTTFTLQLLDPSVRLSASGNFNVLCGFGQGIVVIASAAVMLPVLELSFGVWTKVKLLNLTLRDQPLMKRLMIEAGGTHNHSLRVAELARNACEAVGANSVVALVSSYYHDIGKLRRPGYFIENTPLGGDNPHDKLRPEMSVRILIEHVTYGVELAKEYKLPAVIIDAIRQHHGTSLIWPFYHKALEEAKRTGETVSESDFRYPGQRPKSREVGIIMLADSVEAASRVLTEPTREKIARMVDRIVARYIEDHQLDECDLTLNDIRKCKQSFVMQLEGMLHSRVDYPLQQAGPGESG